MTDCCHYASRRRRPGFFFSLSPFRCPFFHSLVLVVSNQQPDLLLIATLVEQKIDSFAGSKLALLVLFFNSLPATTETKFRFQFAKFIR